jgi:putative sterol carrier protein
MADPKTDFEQRIPKSMQEDPDKFKNVGAIFLFKISGDGGGTWTLDCKNDPAIHEGEHGEPDCTIEISDEDWKTMTDNPQAGMQLYFQGKLKVSGNAMLATKLQQILG